MVFLNGDSEAHPWMGFAPPIFTAASRPRCSSDNRSWRICLEAWPISRIKPMWISGQGKDQCEGFVHSSHLARTQVPLEVIQPTHVQGAQLLHHHPRWLTSDVNLGSEARRPHALGSRRNEHGRKPEKLIRLDEYGITSPMLLMATAPRQPHAVDIAARHSGQSAAIASMSAITRLRATRSFGSSASPATSAARPDRLRSRSAVSEIAWRAASARVSPRLRAMSSKARQPSSPRRRERGCEVEVTEGA
jgi:hypothetical protein